MSARCADCLNEAIERCEVSGVALCAEHLWYVDDGRRVSERAARQLQSAGRTVYEPKFYLSQLGVEYPPPNLPAPDRPVVRTLPSGADLVSVLAAAMAPASLYAGWRAALGEAVFALLIVAHAAISTVGLRGAGNAVNPRQARSLSMLGMIAACGCLLALVVLYTASIP